MANANSTDWTLGGLDNPLKVQAALLNRFESETGKLRTLCAQLFIQLVPTRQSTYTNI